MNNASVFNQAAHESPDESSECRDSQEGVWPVSVHSSRTDRAISIALTFDDGVSTQLSVAVPLLERYGFPGTFFVIPGLTGSVTSQRGGVNGWGEIGWADLCSLLQNGHEIGNHSFSHRDLTGLRPSEARIDIHQSKLMIEDRLETNVRSFAYPFGKKTQVLTELVFDAHEVAREASPHLDLSPVRFTRATTAWEIFPETLLTQIVHAIEAAVTGQCNLILVFHGFEDRGYRPLSGAYFSHILREIRGFERAGAVSIRRLSDAICNNPRDLLVRDVPAIPS